MAEFTIVELEDTNDGVTSETLEFVQKVILEVRSISKKWDPNPLKLDFMKVELRGMGTRMSGVIDYVGDRCTFTVVLKSNEATDGLKEIQFSGNWRHSLKSIYLDDCKALCNHTELGGTYARKVRENEGDEVTPGKIAQVLVEGILEALLYSKIHFSGIAYSIERTMEVLQPEKEELSAA